MTSSFGVGAYQQGTESQNTVTYVNDFQAYRMGRNRIRQTFRPAIQLGDEAAGDATAS